MANKCGAKTRANGRCQQPGMKNGRCRYHGGLSTGPGLKNQNAVKHGFYCDALQPDELVLWHRVEVGSVDDEIKLMKVKLHRLVRLSGSADVAELIDSAFEVALKHDTHAKIGSVQKRELQVKVPQYAELMIQAINQIRQLELARKDLNKVEPDAPAGEDGPVHKIVVEVVGARTAHDDDRAPG